MSEVLRRQCATQWYSQDNDVWHIRQWYSEDLHRFLFKVQFQWSRSATSHRNACTFTVLYAIRHCLASITVSHIVLWASLSHISYVIVCEYRRLTHCVLGIIVLYVIRHCILCNKSHLDASVDIVLLWNHKVERHVAKLCIFPTSARFPGWSLPTVRQHHYANHRRYHAYFSAINEFMGCLK